jgi:2-oxoisovalerate dehydrogenase E1 component
VRIGDVLAEVETSKATEEIATPVAGTVEFVQAQEGQMIAVGHPILAIRADAGRSPTTITEERPGNPCFRRRRTATANSPKAASNGAVPDRQVGILAIAGATGSRVVPNSEILKIHPGRSEADVFRRTGIESRRWVGPGEDVVSLALRASRSALETTDLEVQDLDLIVCCTSTPSTVTPSLACQVLAGLSDPTFQATVQAYDINAACSGYLYALRAAHDFLQSVPDGRVLLVTSEVLSERLNKADFGTAFLFGDAASATILVGEKHLTNGHAVVHRPAVSAKGDRDAALSVPLWSPDNGHITMSGTKIFTEAVRSMAAMLNRACDKAGITMDRLSMVIPHQANQRIIDAVGRRTGLPMHSNIAHLGNTSSSSLPLALSEVIARHREGRHVGLCTFGGGFTFGAAVLELDPPCYPPRQQHTFQRDSDDPSSTCQPN